MIKLQTTPAQEVTLQSYEPLTVSELTIMADNILDTLCAYRPEFERLVRLHRNTGCRYQELFQSDRWTLIGTTSVQVQPQKGNASRLLQLSSIGVENAVVMGQIKDDMDRLPSRQYDRAFSLIVHQQGLWRLYEEGFAHPSTHFFRHVKIKELAAQGRDKSYIASWIGEKSEDNLDYYLSSHYYI